MMYHVLYQFNEKYAPYASVSMVSLLENNRRQDVTFWILGENLTADSIEKLSSLTKRYTCQVRFVETEGLVAKMKALQMPTYRGSYAANMRLFLSEVLPQEVGRVLYVDADTVIAGKLDLLFELDLSGKSVGMVMDSLGELHKQEIGLSGEDGYYNSGVILFDMKRWELLDLSSRIADHVKHVRANYPSPDQDLLNVVCKEEIYTLPPSYNFQPAHIVFPDKSYFKYYGRTRYYTEEELSEARKQPVIYHFFRFVGEFPWHKGTVHPDKDLFDTYLQMSPFCDYKKQKAQLSPVLRIEKVLYRILPKSWFLGIFQMAHRRFYKKANALSEQNQISKSM